MTIEEFANIADLRVDCYHKPEACSPWIAHIDKAEIGENGMLAGVCGWGLTPAHALADMASRIRGKKLVIGAYARTRREIHVPESLA